MGQPVKLSDEVVLDARATAAISQRSISGQVEFWARLGRAMEPLLRGDRVLALQRAGTSRSLTEAVAEADSEAGRARVKAYLASRPFPHFEPCAESPGFLVRIDEDGTRIRGRFVNREFVAEN